jgi:CheY-like chemotaxis protein
LTNLARHLPRSIRFGSQRGCAASSCTILVVDDDALLRMVVADDLDDRGFRVLEAANGVEAVAMLTETETAIDIVFSDIQMPGLDGLGLARWVVKNRPAVQVVLASGRPTCLAELAPDLCHLAPVMLKPYRCAILARQLRMMLERKLPGRPGIKDLG